MFKYRSMAKMNVGTKMKAWCIDIYPNKIEIIQITIIEYEKETEDSRISSLIACTDNNGNHQ